MKSSGLCSGILLAICSITSICCAAAPHRDDIPRAVVESGKRATAFVETKEATGSSFCIDSVGIFVTNKHVVGDNTTVTLVLNSGEKDQRTVKADVIEEGKDLDLVLLKTQGGGPYKKVMVAPSDDDLIETTSLVVFGFPFGKELTFEEGKFPNVTVSTGHVTALRKDQGVLASIQLDATVTPGSSGGAVLDSQGRVIGIIQAAIEGAPINFAIPVDHLQMLMLRPSIQRTSGTIPLARQEAANTLTFKIAPYNGKHVDYQVTFTLDPHTNHSRSLPVTIAGGDIFTVTTEPTGKSAGTGQLLISATSPEGNFNTTLADREITVGGKKVRLREIQSIEPSANEPVHLRNGKTLSGTILGLSDVPITINGIKAKVDLTQSQTIQISDAGAGRTAFRFEIEVKANGKRVAVTEDVLPYEHDPNGVASEAPKTKTADSGAVGQSKGGIAFRPHITLTVPGMGGYSGLAVYDIDGDGHLDILVTANNDLVVLYGHGDGVTFDMVRYPITQKGSHIQVGDLNKDGKPDVVVSCNDCIQVLLNLGARRFGKAAQYNTGSGPNGIAIADFNGDGKPDLAVAHINSNNMAVLLNNGDGTFGEPTRYGTSQYAIGIVAADFNGDGKIDIGVGCYYAGGVNMFYGDGKGGFTRVPNVSPEVGGGKLVSGDFKHDGHLGLAGVNYWGGNIGIVTGDGRGGFSQPQRIGSGGFPSQISVGDINGDGKLDVIFGSQATHVFSICLNKGDGTFSEALTFEVPDGDVHGAVIGDLNEDGRADVVADGGKEHLYIFINVGNR